MKIPQHILELAAKEAAHGWSEEEEKTYRDYWSSSTPSQRIAAMEIIRAHVYGFDLENPPRIRKVVKIIQMS